MWNSFLMNCACWDVYGLGSREKLSTINKLVRKSSFSFLGLVETKHKRTCDRKVRRIWNNDEFEWCEVLANDNGRDCIVFEKTQIYKGERWVIIEGTLGSQNGSAL